MIQSTTIFARYVKELGFIKAVSIAIARDRLEIKARVVRVLDRILPSVRLSYGVNESVSTGDYISSSDVQPVTIVDSKAAVEFPYSLKRHLDLLREDLSDIRDNCREEMNDIQTYYDDQYSKLKEELGYLITVLGDKTIVEWEELQPSEKEGLVFWINDDLQLCGKIEDFVIELTNKIEDVVVDLPLYSAT